MDTLPRHRTVLFSLLAFALTIVFGWSIGSASARAANPPEFAPGVVLVGYDEGTPAAKRAAARAEIGARSSRPLSPLSRAAERVQLAPGADLERAIAALKRNPNVSYAEPDYRVQTAEVSNDPYFTSGNLWGMYSATSAPANAFGSRAAAAWASGLIGSSDVYVGIIDEGADFNHPDLAANFWTNPDEVAGNGLDDDANGYADDVRGWDFFERNASTFDGAVDDHGTHVSGTIGGVGGNGIGVAGINWNVKMISAKFLGPDGGYISDAVLATDYLTALKKRKGIKIVASSNSWSGGGFSQSMLDAVNRGGDADILFVAAAGNGGPDGVGDSNDSTPTYPANYQCTKRFDTGAARGYDCVISVAAITSSGARSSFSNYGVNSVDIGAPGSAIYSTLPGSTYGSYSGTSMATPHVSGTVALCAASNANLTAQQIRTTILGSAIPTTSLASITASGARLDAGSAATNCAAGITSFAKPAAFNKTSPLNGAIGQATSQTVKWGISAGAARYEICADTTNDNACSGTWTNLGNVTSATIRGNSRSTIYWQVRAGNASGTTDANAGAWWRYTVK